MGSDHPSAEFPGSDINPNGLAYQQYPGFVRRHLVYRGLSVYVNTGPRAANQKRTIRKGA